jgi:hypothetical protein
MYQLVCHPMLGLGYFECSRIISSLTSFISLGSERARYSGLLHGLTMGMKMSWNNVAFLNFAAKTKVSWDTK